MTADKVQTFMLKDKKQRPEVPKKEYKKVASANLKTNEQQDEGVNLQRILSYYRDRVQAHEHDRHLYLQKMEMLRVKQDKAHQIEWELRKRTSEFEEVKMAVDQCQNHLGSERGTIMEMKFGGERLKQKQGDNQK